MSKIWTLHELPLHDQQQVAKLKQVSVREKKVNTLPFKRRWCKCLLTVVFSAGPPLLFWEAPCQLMRRICLHKTDWFQHNKVKLVQEQTCWVLENLGAETRIQKSLLMIITLLFWQKLLVPSVQLLLPPGDAKLKLTALSWCWETEKELTLPPSLRENSTHWTLRFIQPQNYYNTLTEQQSRPDILMKRHDVTQRSTSGAPHL